jgi:hypothetical protein
VAKLKELKEELASLQALQEQGMPYEFSLGNWTAALADASVEENVLPPAGSALSFSELERLSVMLSLTGIYLASPLQSFSFYPYGWGFK